MKKLKLLSSLSALVLVLSLGACTQPEEDTSSEGNEPTSSESSSDTTSPSESEPVVLNNYTLSITLKDADGNPVVIPFYDVVYIQGSWDDWTDWIALTDAGDELGSVLTTTFTTLSEGNYEFKGLVGDQDDEPSWKLAELITAEDGKNNATFTVSAEDGDNHTNNLVFTVDTTKIPVRSETSYTDDEIIGIILEAAANAYENGLGWAAFHGEAVDTTLDETIDANMTTDAKGNLYGSILDYEDDDLSFEYYYVDGVEYSHGLSADNYFTAEDPDDFEYGEDLDAVIENFNDGLTPFAYVESVEERNGWVLEHEEGTSLYSLSIPGDSYTDTVTLRRAGDVFSIISFSETSAGELISSAEETTAAVVEATMTGFNADFWNPLYFGKASNPAELAEKAALRKNYSVEIEYDIFVGENTLTYGDYIRYYEIYYGLIYGYDPDTQETLVEGSDRYNQLYAEFEALGEKFDTLTEDLTIESYIADIYYTENSVLYIEYVYDEDEEDYVRDGCEHIYVNDPDVGIWHYYTEDGSQWHIQYGNAGYSWWNYTYSLVAGYSYADYLEYYTAYEGQDVYYFNNYWEYYYGVSFYWFCYLGGELLFGDYSTAWYYMAYNFVEEGTYFSKEDQTMTTIWSTAEYGNLLTDDDDLTDDSELYFYEEDMTVTVYDVGETEEDPEVAYWHNYWQNYMANN